MSNRKLIGRVSATEKYPSSCDDFQFWLSDDTILSPFDIVRVENKTDDSITYGSEPHTPRSYAGFSDFHMGKVKKVCDINLTYAGWGALCVENSLPR